MKLFFKLFSLKRTANIAIILGAIIAILGCYLFGYNQHYNTENQIEPDIFGNLGSFLSGTVGSLWSLASIMYFIIALKEQRADIKKNQELQSLQRFETTFFQLAQQHSNTVNELIHDDRTGVNDKGKVIFDDWKKSLDLISKGCSFKDSTLDDDGNIISSDAVEINSEEEFHEYFCTQYSEVYLKYENTFNHYFRQLYHIFKYLHLTPLIKDEERHFYSSLLTAQLSQNELYAIAFNSVNEDYGYPKFAYLIKEYKILKQFNHRAIPGTFAWNYISNKIKNVINPF